MANLNLGNLCIGYFYHVPYSGNVWHGKSVVNLTNEQNFAKLKSSKPIDSTVHDDNCTSIQQAFSQNHFTKHYHHQTFPLSTTYSNFFEIST